MEKVTLSCKKTRLFRKEITFYTLDLQGIIVVLTFSAANRHQII